MEKRGISGTFFVTIAIALVLFLLLTVFYDDIFGAARVNIDNKLSCKGAFGVGFGECTNKDQCQPPSQSMISNDCLKESKDLICCISLEKPDSILPEEFGGNSQYNFVVEYVGPRSVPSGCTKQNNHDYELVCTPGRTITLSIKVGVKNTGSSPVDIFANPTIVDLSGSLSPVVKQGVATRVNSGQKQEVFVDYTFTGPGTETGRSYRIYAAAKCTSSDCKKTNSEGIYRKLEGAYMNVAFTQ